MHLWRCLFARMLTWRCKKCVLPEQKHVAWRGVALCALGKLVARVGLCRVSGPRSGRRRVINVARQPPCEPWAVGGVVVVVCLCVCSGREGAHCSSPSSPLSRLSSSNSLTTSSKSLMKIWIWRVQARVQQGRGERGASGARGGRGAGGGGRAIRRFALGADHASAGTGGRGAARRLSEEHTGAAMAAVNSCGVPCRAACPCWGYVPRWWIPTPARAR